jgi:regulator of cell morphogenesis and NO signaling
MTTLFADRTVADIAASLPGATAIFRRHKLDFCCGGGARLADAAGERGASLPEIEAELATLAPAGSAAPEATDALIDHILARYHDVHRREFPELERLARRVEAVHRDNPSVPKGLADLLAAMGEDMEEHMQKEEQVLFPILRAGGTMMAARPIAVMRMEHDSHARHLHALEALTDHGTPPEGACNTWRALYAGTRKLADDLMEHMHLENNVLFPRFGA